MTRTVNDLASAVPPFVLTTFLNTISVAYCWLTNVQLISWPSAATMVAVAVATFTVLVLVSGTPFSVAEHARLFNPNPWVLASVIVTGAVVPKENSLNCCWLAGSVPAGGVTPSFTSVKFGGTSGTPFVDELVAV